MRHVFARVPVGERIGTRRCLEARMYSPAYLLDEFKKLIMI